MADINNVVNSTQLADDIDDRSSVQNVSEATPEQSSSGGKEKNYTDPKVCHDPVYVPEGIARIRYNQNKVEMEDGELSAINAIDSIKTDGITYPLLVINERDINPYDIVEFTIDYYSFVPTIYVTIHDETETEKKFSSTQMSGRIRTCMIATVDNVYKKILLNFKITSSYIDPDDPTIVSYTGEYYVPLFKQTNIGHIWMPEVCPKSPTCMQGGHINANTWEMLHKIAELSGLGFAATKMCKEISDRVIRHAYTQRFDQFIIEQISHCGLGEENIFDAWVDLYGYIVQVNVPWVLSQSITNDDLSIIATTGMHGTSNNLPDQEPVEVERTLTDFNQIGAVTNMEILDFTLKTQNDAVTHGTLEHVFIINFVGTKTKMEELDVQTKQNSVDGEFLEEYNTGKNTPIPKFNFNDDEYTELPGGYDLDKQKIIRNAFFRKHRQTVWEVTLKYMNFGLQRGTLVNISINETDTTLKHNMIKNLQNLVGDTDIKEADLDLSPDMNEKDLKMTPGASIPNIKPSGLYYIDGMRFEYDVEKQEMRQILILFKKGILTGYNNRNSTVKMAAHKVEQRETLPQDPPFIEEYNGHIT